MRGSIAVVYLLLLAAFPAAAQQMPYLPCGDCLERPYGICTDITVRNGGEFDIRDDALKKVSDCGAAYVRIPLSWNNFLSPDGKFAYDRFDSVVESLSLTPLTAIGIISPRFDRTVTAWSRPSSFASYVKEMSRRYCNAICDWEVFNGSDELYSSGIRISAAGYCSVLRGVSTIIKSSNPAARIVLGTPYNVQAAFLDSLSVCGAQNYFDVLTFTSYGNPEEIPQLAMKLRRAMLRGGWSKPVWLTNVSCGYRPCIGAPLSFWAKDVPYALREAGIVPGKTTVCIVEKALNEDEVTKYIKGIFKSYRFVKATDVHLLDAKSCLVLIPGRNVPQSEIAGYVQSGGTVIIGSPRWSSVTHVGVAPGEGRYLSDDRLSEGERMIPLTVKDGKVYSAYYRLSTGGAIVLSGSGAAEYVDRETEQAAKVARIHILAFASGVEKVFWNGLRSPEQDPGVKRSYAGLYHSDMTQKPALKTYKTITALLPEGSTRPVMEYSGKIYLAGWSKPDGIKVYAVWNIGEAAPNCLEVTGKATILDQCGSRMKSIDEITDEVIYIEGAEKVEFKKDL